MLDSSLLMGGFSLVSLTQATARGSSQSRMSRPTKAKKFEEVFRVYHEVEDVGKTVKQSKRRARWTFSFGETGAEREVVLIHSVVSGKKIVMYDAQEIYHSDEMTRAFSYSWYDQEHVLRLDIIDLVEVGTQIAKNRAEKMYELTIDGVPFGVLNLKPLHLPGRQASTRTTHRAERAAELDDDFDPRASAAVAPAVSNPKPVVVSKPVAPVVDLLSMDDAPAPAPTLPGPSTQASSSFDPFGGGSDFSTGFNVRRPDPFSGGGTSSFDVAATRPKPVPGFGGTLTAEDWAYQVGSASFAPRPQLTYTPANTAPSNFTPLQQGTPERALTVIGTTSTTPDLDKATASLVNLSNLMDDGPAKPTSATYKPVYTDNRSLAEMKATTKSSQPAKPVFLERPQAPAFAPGPLAFGAPPPRVFPGGAPPMPGFGFPQQQPRPMGFAPPGGVGFAPHPGFPMGGGPPPHQQQGFGAFPQAPRPGVAFPPRPPSNDPFYGL